MKIDKKRTSAYFNLTKRTFSLTQSGRVYDHADFVAMWGVTFNVSRKGQERVRKERCKNVHAKVSGFVDRYLTDQLWNKVVVPATADDRWACLMCSILNSNQPDSLHGGNVHITTARYNPYRDEGFIDNQTGSVITRADLVLLTVSKRDNHWRIPSFDQLVAEDMPDQPDRQGASSITIVNYLDPDYWRLSNGGREGIQPVLF